MTAAETDAVKVRSRALCPYHEKDNLSVFECERESASDDEASCPNSLVDASQRPACHPLFPQKAIRGTSPISDLSLEISFELKGPPVTCLFTSSLQGGCSSTAGETLFSPLAAFERGSVDIHQIQQIAIFDCDVSSNCPSGVAGWFARRSGPDDFEVSAMKTRPDPSEIFPLSTPPQVGGASPSLHSFAYRNLILLRRVLIAHDPRVVFSMRPFEVEGQTDCAVGSSAEPDDFICWKYDALHYLGVDLGGHNYNFRAWRPFQLGVSQAAAEKIRELATDWLRFFPGVAQDSASPKFVIATTGMLKDAVLLADENDFFVGRGLPAIPGYVPVERVTGLTGTWLRRTSNLPDVSSASSWLHWFRDQWPMVLISHGLDGRGSCWVKGEDHLECGDFDPSKPGKTYRPAAPELEKDVIRSAQDGESADLFDMIASAPVQIRRFEHQPGDVRSVALLEDAKVPSEGGPKELLSVDQNGISHCTLVEGEWEDALSTEIAAHLAGAQKLLVMSSKSPSNKQCSDLSCSVVAAELNEDTLVRLEDRTRSSTVGWRSIKKILDYGKRRGWWKENVQRGEFVACLGNAAPEACKEFVKDPRILLSHAPAESDIMQDEALDNQRFAEVACPIHLLAPER